MGFLWMALYSLLISTWHFFRWRGSATFCVFPTDGVRCFSLIGYVYKPSLRGINNCFLVRRGFPIFYEFPTDGVRWLLISTSPVELLFNPCLFHINLTIPFWKRFCEFCGFPTDGVHCVTRPVSGLTMLNLHPIRIPSMRDPICIYHQPRIHNKEK